MRVALNGWFWDQPNTGSGQYLRRLVAGLARFHPDDEFLVLYPGGMAPDTATDAPNVTFSTTPAAAHNHLSKVWWEQVQVPRLARRAGVALLHVPYWASPWQRSVPTLVTIHDLIPLLLPAYRGSVLVRLYTALVRATATRAALALTDSESSRQDIVRHLRMPDERVCAVPLAADPTHRPESSHQDALCLAEMGLAPGYLLYCGGFDVRKNLRTILAAFAQLRRTLPDARLVLAGSLPRRDSDFAPDPRRLAREVGVPEATLVFTGFAPETHLPALYRGARALIFLSEYEGFGFTPLEALACGTPVVASNVSSLPEVVGDGGILAAPTDATAAAAAAIRLLTDDAFHAEMRDRALRQAARFSWEATAKATWAAYASVMESSPGAGTPAWATK